MRHTTIILLLLAITSHGQTTLADQQDKKRLDIEKRLTSDKNKLIVLVKVNGQTDLQKVVEENWPANIETTYNILKSQGGQIIYIGEFPTSESGDWTLGLKHYFSDNGKLIAFEKRLSYFNDDCTDGAVIEKQIELYDNQFNVIKTTQILTDNKGQPLSEKDCGNGYNWDIDKRPTVKELIDLKGIRE